MADFPCMPLWIDAYLADTEHLSDEEHGRYLKLLMMLWRAPDQRLPNDDNWLSRRFRRTVDDVRKTIRPLIDEFCQCDGNWISQKRLTMEWKKVKTRSEKATVSANTRWNKDKHTYVGNASEHDPSNASISISIKKDTRASGARSSPEGFELFYQAYPLHKARGAALKAYVRACQRATPEELLEGAKRYALEKAGTDPGYLAHPATWLNQERWKDEVPKKSNGAGGYRPMGPGGG